MHVIVSGERCARPSSRFEDLLAARAAGALHRADHPRRHVLLALHLGLDRQAQGGGACACQPAADRRSLCRRRSRPERERPLLLGRQAVLRLRARQCHDLSALGRRHHRAVARAADAGGRRRRPAPASGHRVLRRADLLCGVPGEPGRARRAPSCSCAAASRPARRCRRMSAGAGRSATASTSSTASARPRCCTSSSPTVPATCSYGTTGKPVPGYDIRLVDDDGSVIESRGEMGELQVRGPTSAVMYWNNREQIARDLPGRMDALRRQIPARTTTATTSTAAGATTCSRSAASMSRRSRSKARSAPIPTCWKRRWSPGPTTDDLIKPKAFVVLKSARPGRRAISRAPCRSTVKAALAPYKYPRWIEFRTELPKTATGKIQRFKLRAESPAP